MNRKEARMLGLTHYRTEKPCKRGHLADRFVSSGHCVECAKARDAAWRKNNPEQALASWHKWLNANRDTHNTRVKRWQTANSEKVKADRKQWALDNPDKVKAKAKRYREKHPDRIAARAVLSTLRRAQRLPKWLTPDDKWAMREAYSLAKLRTKLTGVVWEVDHILPLRGNFVSGLHVPANLQVIPKELNREKRNVFIPS